MCGGPRRCFSENKCRVCVPGAVQAGFSPVGGKVSDGAEKLGTSVLLLQQLLKLLKPLPDLRPLVN